MAVVAGGLLDEVQQDPAQVGVATVADGALGDGVQVEPGDELAVTGGVRLVVRQQVGEGRSTAIRISRSGSSSVQGPSSSPPRNTTSNQ